MSAAEALSGHPVAAALGQAVAEVLFAALVAAWWLVCVQWNLVDQILGGPDLNQGHMATSKEQELEARGVTALLSYSASRAGRAQPGSFGPKSACDPAAAAAAARRAASLEGRESAGRGGAGASPLTGSRMSPADGKDTASAFSDAAARSEAAPEASAPEKGGQPQFGGRRSESASELELQSSGTPRSIYASLKRRLHGPNKSPAISRPNVKQRVQARVKRFGLDMFPDMAQSIGVEAAAGTLATAIPSGVRDAGVRMVDRAEALLRRWAVFCGGAALLYRALLWH